MANQHSSQPAAHIAGEISSASFEEIPHLIERYGDDPRRQVSQALDRARRRYDRETAERDRVRAMYARMRALGGDGVIVGVDEVGRGSVAGPLLVCAVVLPDTPLIWGINDSKKLTPAKRELLAERIADVAVGIGFGQIPASEIDEGGMARALRRAVQLAVADLGIAYDCVLMDGNPLHAVERERDVVHGDAEVACIAAASIVAKVTRDELMVELDAEYPGYHLAESKGYASPEHIAAIKERGLCPEHRVSFCGNFLETENLF